MTDTNKGRQELLDELNACRDTIRSLTAELNEARTIIQNAIAVLNSNACTCGTQACAETHLNTCPRRFKSTDLNISPCQHDLKYLVVMDGVISCANCTATNLPGNPTLTAIESERARRNAR